MIWRVEIKDKEGVFDAAGESTKKAIFDLGIRSISHVRVISVFLIEGNLSRAQIQTICEELLVDKIIQEYSFCPNQETAIPSARTPFIVEIAYHPGVMDPVEASTLKGIRDLDIEGVQAVHTARKYILDGDLAEDDLDVIVNKVLSNKLIQHVVRTPLKETKKISQEKHIDVFTVDLLKANNKKLLRISKEGQLFLNLKEMKAIQAYFKKLKRNPTDCELETIAQTWSEHCYHKTFRGDIRYTSEENGKKKTQLIRSLLKSTIMKATKEIGKSWCVSVFHDNAGVIKFDADMHVCFKVETHNHPSALEPFGGANTGIGGVIRDVLGTGLGGKPICNTDVFCFAPPDYPFDRLPEGTLHPKRIMKGVVSGVRDYGNKMGIPTVNGAIIFDERFVGNPLVYCGTVGLIPKDCVKKKALKGDLIVAVGGRTGRDGIHGATFSSGELTHESEHISSGAVQIGDPIQEKKVLDVLMQARDRHLYSAITDCGAGGFSSAAGEMGQELGCKIDLDKAPLKYEGLSYTEIWISESQERMVLAVPKKNIKALLKIFADENVEATVIGEFTGTKRLELFFHGRKVASLDMNFLHQGPPRGTQEALWAKPKSKEPKISCPDNLTNKLYEILSHYNVCSKEWVIRQYDHEVQGTSVIKSLVGPAGIGPCDASVIRPKLNSSKAIAISNGINIRFGMIDPFWMAASCIDEAIRQIVAVGGNPERIAILDNFCWGNPDKKDRLGSMVRAALGCYQTALGYQVPFISGKDSLNNEYADKGKLISIPGTLLISAIGIVDDVSKTLTMDFKKDGNLIYLIGATSDELGGSIYYDTYRALGKNVPLVNTKKGQKLFKAMHRASQKGLLQSAHDCSEGGLGVALAEMCFAGQLGASVFLKDVRCQGGLKRNDAILFSESNTRFVVEVAAKDRKAFERIFDTIPCGLIGCVSSKKVFTVYGLDGNVCVVSNIDSLKNAWQKTLDW
ncbi:MAG: phosphoribosylformylglycinamidine synthase subunit PurL [Candidatus Omnitrophota bacterium]